VNKEDGYDQSYVYSQVMNHLYTGLGEKDGLSTALRLLIHYVGDIHQPLHASTRVNYDYPKGDRGGNDFVLPSHYGVKELHAVWDDVFWEYFHKQATPFSEDDWAAQGKNVSAMVTKWPVDSDQAKDMDPMSWASESYEITTSFVYKGIKENVKLPDSYNSKGLDLCEQRIVLAGTRLANLLKSLNLDSIANDKTTFYRGDPYGQSPEQIEEDSKMMGAVMKMGDAIQQTAKSMIQEKLEVVKEKVANNFNKLLGDT